MKRVLAFFTALALCTASLAADPARVTVFAAASMGQVLQDLAESYAAPVRISAGGSGVMARQVAAGAPADVVILANPDWMAWLSEQTQIDLQGIHTLAHNTLVLVGPMGSSRVTPDQIINTLAGNRLAMGHRNAVPAGGYAQEWLSAAGLWQGLQTQLAETDNVRAALNLVARRETPLGIVYATDAAAEPKVAVVYDVPTDQHSPILYPAAALSPQGVAFLNYLTSPAAKAVFETHGFGAAAP